MRYENLLTRTLRILRSKPWLWPLALLAGDTSGGGGGGSTNLSLPNGSLPPSYSWVPQWFADRLTLFLEVAIAILLLGLAWFLVSCVASGALVGAVARIDAGEPTRFGSAWRLGTAAFRRVLLLKLLVLLLILAPALLLALPPLLGAMGGMRFLLTGLLLDVPLLFFYLAWAAFIGWLSELALRACVLQELGPWASFIVAYALLRRRFHRVALTTLVFIAVGFGIGVLTAVIYAVIQVPLIATLTAQMAQGRWNEALASALIWSAVLVPVSLAISSAVGAYFATAWTLAYRRFDVEGELSEPPLAA